jgi:hypothetical protein
VAPASIEQGSTSSAIVGQWFINVLLPTAQPVLDVESLNDMPADAAACFQNVQLDVAAPRGFLIA